MCDTDGHSSIWAVDSSYRVTETQRSTGDPNSEVPWIATYQGWDSNNDLTSTTDANGNTTNYGYDSGGSGDMVEMQLPSATDFYVNNTTVTLSPLSYYSHDGNHNITAYCDPVWTNNNNKTWNNSPGESLCPSGSNKTTQLTYYSNDTSEPFGCLTAIAKPSGYSSTISYTGGSGNCGLGLPSQVKGTQITQYNNGTRTPTQNFTYDTYGNLYTYNKGRDNLNNVDDSWTLAYSADNQLVQTTENDSVIPLTESSMSCYYPDGSVFYTLTPSQRNQDGDPTCPSTTTLLGGPASPKPHASAFYYDLDGDQVKAITHKGCDTNTPCGGPISKTVCNNSETSNPIGTTCKYYDGLDRLVETIEPYDNRQFSGGTFYEFYSFRWMDRYIYDLSMSGGSAALTIADETGSTSSFAGYGNLYKTQEYLPQSSSMVATYNQSYSSAGWSDVRGSSFDALDRAVSKYELSFPTGTAKAAVTTNTYDGTGEYGLLSETENAVQQVTSYAYDGDARQEQVQFTGAPLPLAGNRAYAYDPDGRTATAESANLGMLYYAYDVDGNKLSVTEPSQEPAASLICYQYYGDGSREFLSIGLPTDSCSGSGNNIPFRSQPSNGGISQPSIFSYAYRNDGVLANQLVTWGTLPSELFTWKYYPSEREETETDPTAQTAQPPPPPGIAYTPPDNSNPGTTMVAKTYSYDPYGRVSGLTLPAGYQESTLVYDTDDELAGAKYSAASVSMTRSIALNARGEAIEDITNNGLIPPAQGVTQSANGAQVGDGNGEIAGNYYSAPPTTLQFDVRNNMAICIPNPQWALQITTGPNMFTYDGAGRQVQTSTEPNTYGCGNQNATVTSGVNFDAENHIKNTTNANGAVTGSAYWGPDGLQRENNAPGGPDEQAHWDGNSLLFSTANSSGVPDLYLGKLGEMDLAGDIVILDRDQTGSRMSAHGYVAAPPFWMKGNYWYDGLTVGTVRNIYVAKANKQYFLSFFTGSCNFTLTDGTSYKCPPDLVAFPMIRGDGYGMLGGIVQGARTYDPTSGQWLTPDAYAGDVSDPMSQKPFMWNGNNPIQYADPSGYLLDPQGDTDEKQQEMNDWNAMKASVKNNPQATAILNNIEHNPNFTVALSENNSGKTQFSGTYEGGKLTNDRIDFDPHMAIQLNDQGAAISPALALLHEADHANEFNMNYNKYATDISTDAGAFGNMEEKRVITGLEAQVLNSQGLTPRLTHDNTFGTCTVSSMSSSQC
jgi:RHS repeat-associated protein